MIDYMALAWLLAVESSRNDPMQFVAGKRHVAIMIAWSAERPNFVKRSLSLSLPSAAKDSTVVSDKVAFPTVTARYLGLEEINPAGASSHPLPLLVT
ncbi:hypothetical protein GCM10011452_38720 [Gemmobacter lanyuensis]|uniref:Uncharacterized protein n=1 Tax=Gemmobacter lanyuensis TaxID=1054497 RepID=A0A918J4H6_9RHOB|nr:hypothetical protein GCM10011452_38720 [Gemmobacter lanyuensis]